MQTLSLNEIIVKLLPNLLFKIFSFFYHNNYRWVNRKDPNGHNIFSGGFLGLDNIGKQRYYCTVVTLCNLYIMCVHVLIFAKLLRFQ